ncbi:MAG: flagellar hook-basal body complex protein FliE [Gammaproteobacteria bacterium]
MNTINADSLLVQMRALAARAQGAGAVAETPAAGGDFGQLMRTALERVNQTQQASVRAAAAFEAGAPGVELADVMLAMQKSSLSFQAATQVRNKLVSAYQDIMNMPI